MNQEKTVMLVVVAGFLTTISLLAAFLSIPIFYGTDSTIIGQTVRLTEFMPGTDSAIVHAEIVIVVDRNVQLILGGDVTDLRLDTISGATNIELNDVKAVSYDGPLVLNGPASAGDEVEILIRHGGSETAVTAVLEGRHATAGAGS